MIRGTVCSEPLCTHPAWRKGRCRIHQKSENRPSGWVRYDSEHRAARDRHLAALNGSDLCGHCGQPLGSDPTKLDLDHIVPLHHGGTGRDENLRLIHARCNRSKGARFA